MILVEDYNAISKLIFKKLKKGVITNTFLSKEDYELEISNKNLYYFEFDNSLILYRVRDNRYILNFYFNDLDSDDFKNHLANELSSKDKPIVVEVVQKDNDEQYNKIFKIFEELKFQNIENRVRYENKICCLNNKEKFEYPIDYANATEANLILKKFNDCFNEFYGCIPTLNMIKNRIENHEIFVLKREDSIAAVLEISRNKSTVEIRHLCVDESFRNMKLGTILLNYLLKNTECNDVLVWTGNKVAQTLYTNNGFEQTNYKSKVYILK